MAISPKNKCRSSKQEQRTENLSSDMRSASEVAQGTGKNAVELIVECMGIPDAMASQLLEAWNLFENGE